MGSRDASSNAVFCVCFRQRSQGEYLASVEDNEYHTVTVWDWTRKKKITSARVRSTFIDRYVHAPNNFCKENWGDMEREISLHTLYI